MGKGEPPGVKRLTLQCLDPGPDCGILNSTDPPRAAVNLVPHDRITKFRQVDPDLMGPARFDIHIQQGSNAETPCKAASWPDFL